MITQAQINEHDRVIQKFVRDFAQGLLPLFRSALDNISQMGSTVSRTEILAQFLPIRNYINSQFAQLNTVINSNTKLNQSVADSQVSTGQVQLLAAEATAAVINQLETEQQSIIQTIVLGSIAGLAIAPFLSQLRSAVSKSVKRLTTVFDFIVRNFDGALTLIKSKNSQIQKFKYVGGTISTTRDFCRTHNGKIYTQDEINKIWRGQTWGGKAPGDPFIVRGGYNCRHFFVPVSDS
jgi:hypothetical protein